MSFARCQYTTLKVDLLESRFVIPLSSAKVLSKRHIRQHSQAEPVTRQTMVIARAVSEYSKFDQLYLHISRTHLAENLCQNDVVNNRADCNRRHTDSPGFHLLVAYKVLAGTDGMQLVGKPPKYNICDSWFWILRTRRYRIPLEGTTLIMSTQSSIPRVHPCSPRVLSLAHVERKILHSSLFDRLKQWTSFVTKDAHL